MFTIDNRMIHGTSFIISLDSVEFITWRLNEDTGDYWVKLHIPSGKEIRIKVSEEELRNIADVWAATSNIYLKIGDNYGMDF
jgi:hypothetical protein